MGRIRAIKPSFFLDEDLGDLSPLHRLLFAGLWTMADSEGRLEDRPRRIKAELLPYDDCDIGQLLEDLAKPHRGDHRFIIRYEAAGQALIALPNFRKHQRISGKEASTPSTFPAPPAVVMVKQSGSSGEAAVAQEGKGREGKGEKHSSPSAPGVTPSDIDTTGIVEDEDLARAGAHAHVAEDVPDPDLVLQPEFPGTPPPPGPDDVMRVWNEKAPPKCPRVQKMTDGRVKAAKARLEEHKGEAGGALAWWERVVRRVAASSFLRGDRTTWCADIDFVLKPGSIVKIEEGKYDDRAGDVRTGSVRAEDCHHSEKVGVVSMEEWTGGGKP